MSDKRRFKRIPVDIKIKIDSLYRQDEIVINDIGEEIEILNISRSGLGFLAKHDFPLGFYFNARITMDNEKKFYGVLKIIRKNIDFEDKVEMGLDSDVILYGCEFVGLADVLSIAIDEYSEENKL